VSKGFAAAMQCVKRGTRALSGLVTQPEVDNGCAETGYRSQATLYTPFTTILTFLAQLIGADRSCQQAVNGLVAERVAAGKKKCSADTGAYCKARSRLPEELFWKLLRQSGRAVDEQADPEWNWNGHRVRVADGSTLAIADTDANRDEYPLQRNLKPGQHYPVVRILVIFSLAVGTVLDAAICPYRGKGTGETAMLRSLADLFEPGDVLLADRYFSGYWDMAFWMARSVHVVACISVSRKLDFRKGQRVGRCDHVIEWKKTNRPDWIDEEAVQLVPARLRLRELRVPVNVPGFRTRFVHIVTTLTDGEVYSKESLGDLYRRRWQAELNLRSLKTHMGMRQLRCETPAMVRKEFATYLLAYNCIRRVASEAARTARVWPEKISFKNTMQAINEFFPRLHQAARIEDWIDGLLSTVAEVRVGHRPNRIEPYTCKTRPKDYPPPKEPRSTYKSRKAKQK
jgi:hypothetical protein